MCQSPSHNLQVGLILCSGTKQNRERIHFPNSGLILNAPGPLLRSHPFSAPTLSQQPQVTAVPTRADQAQFCQKGGDFNPGPLKVGAESTGIFEKAGGDCLADEIDRDVWPRSWAP